MPSGKAVAVTRHYLTWSTISRNQYYVWEYALRVFLDISGAFDNLDLTSAQAGMKTFNFPPAIQKWYTHYLENRNVTADIKGCTETRESQKGHHKGEY